MRKKMFQAVFGALASTFPFGIAKVRQTAIQTFSYKLVKKRITTFPKLSIFYTHIYNYWKSNGSIQFVSISNVAMHKFSTNYSFAHIDIILRTSGTLRYPCLKCDLARKQ
ncbi:hypothetical protein HMPREF0044_0786 [Gleimia coleocanis DSM 15436]|uniref:Uncharacterized protein n=1 Tax=Gleimia coleocanis DSM 15436 TaxID=525245 RepID=C0VZQ8_9ACTO|nr:hypothetical protein HMPREF0044_0786 [Gleimia coleocanis DSM 15436]